MLPLVPLEGAVLLPGSRLRVSTREATPGDPLSAASHFGDEVVAAFAEGDSVHGVGVTATVEPMDDGSATISGLSRCRLLGLVPGDVPLVEVELFPEDGSGGRRAGPLAALLLCRYRTLCRRLGWPSPAPTPRDDLGALTWEVAARVGVSAEEHQGFLNVPDSVTRAKLLLLAVREVEQRERFLRPYAHLRTHPESN